MAEKTLSILEEEGTLKACNLKRLCMDSVTIQSHLDIIIKYTNG